MGNFHCSSSISLGKRYIIYASFSRYPRAHRFAVNREKRLYTHKDIHIYIHVIQRIGWKVIPFYTRETNTWVIYRRVKSILKFSKLRTDGAKFQIVKNSRKLNLVPYETTFPNEIAREHGNEKNFAPLFSQNKFIE